MRTTFLVLLSMLLAPTCLSAQQGVPKDSSSVAAQELETIISEAEKLDNKKARVDIKSRAAMLVSFANPARSETMFLEIWKFTNDQTDEAFDKEQARLQILKYLSARNLKLARRLLAEQSNANDAPKETSLPGDDKGLRSATKLASSLADADPSSAAALLEDSLSQGVTPMGVGALSRLRETNSFLSDYVVTKVIDRLLAQPTLVSLPSFFMLGGYVFPGAEAPMTSLDAESSLQLLQFRYFMASHDALRASLGETSEALVKNHHYTPPQLQFRAAYQAQLATVLAALAPRFQPSLRTELTALAAKLAPQVPPNMPQLSRITLSRISGTAVVSDDPETNFLTAVSDGNFDEASRQLDRIKDSEKRDAYAQLLLKSQARFLLAKSDIMGALTAIRKMDDQTVRLVSYLDAIKAVNRKNDAELSSIVVNEARLLVPQTNRNGIHVRALLSFSGQLAKHATKDDAFDFLNNAVVAINSLVKKSGDETEAKSFAEEAVAELNNPLSLFDSPEFEQAFSAAGVIDLDAGLTSANKIQAKPVQLLARVQTIQAAIKRGPGKAKPASSPAKDAPRENSSKP
jgi:hypothetical protein